MRLEEAKNYHSTALLLIGKGFSRQTDKENTGESSERKEVYAKLI